MQHFKRLWFRSPIYLYRLQLGWLGGHQFLLLTHRGRRTGLRRQAVLKVQRFDSVTGEAFVIASKGEHSDWMRNMRSSPPLEVQIGRRRYVPEYRVLSHSETAIFLDDLQRAHPLLTAIGKRLARTTARESGTMTVVSFRQSNEHAQAASAA